MTKHSKAVSKSEIPTTLPVLPILSVVVFPFAIVQLLVRRDKNIKLLRSIKNTDNIIALVAPKDPSLTDPKVSELNEYGVAAKIVNKVDLAEDSSQIVLQGICRIRVKKYIQEEPFFMAEITEVAEKEQSAA